MNKSWLIILLAVVLVSCHKDRPEDLKKQFIINDHTANITFDESHPGNLIPETFEGFSFETDILARDVNFLNANNKVLIRLMKNIGPGILRMGGASSDLTTWAGTARNGDTPLDVITTTDIDRLSAFSKATGWPVLFGLNLANNDTGLAASEAAYVYQSLGSSLYAFQSGNEPDAFGPYTHHRNPAYSFNDFLSEWRGYQSAVQKAVPGANFAGPDIAFNTPWVTAFTDNEGTDVNVKLQDGHYYETGPASNPGIDYHSILGRSLKLPELLQSFKASASKNQPPFRVTECNNVYGGGKRGVSDVFASALWALDVMWILADNGCQGINFHTGIGLYYSPVMNENGILKAKPEYYAMLAFKYGSMNGRTISTKIDEAEYCSAHTCLTNGVYSLTLINKNLDKSFDFNIVRGKNISSIAVSRLTAPSITSAVDVTFGGSKVNADGTFIPSVTENYTGNKTSFIVNVPAGSAAVVTLQ
jgi:hypothetical protein